MNPTLDLSTDEALISSISEHKLGDLKLEPYSLLRQTIAIDLIDRESGTFFAAVMTCYICTLNEDDALDAHANAKETKKKAFKWAADNGYNWRNWKPLVDAYMRLERELAAVIQAQVKPSDELGTNGEQEEIPNSGGQPALSRSPAQ